MPSGRLDHGKKAVSQLIEDQRGIVIANTVLRIPNEIQARFDAAGIGDNDLHAVFLRLPVDPLLTLFGVNRLGVEDRRSNTQPRLDNVFQALRDIRLRLSGELREDEAVPSFLEFRFQKLDELLFLGRKMPLPPRFRMLWDRRCDAPVKRVDHRLLPERLVHVGQAELQHC